MKPRRRVDDGPTTLEQLLAAKEIVVFCGSGGVGKTSVAAAAALGSLRASQPGNNVTISFGNDHREASNISALYRRFAPRKLRPHIDDVMEIQKNAVLLWIVTPPADDHKKIVGCLKG